MLRFVSDGERDFAGRDPRPVEPRVAWEFLAVLRGRCAPVLPTGPLRPAARTLWVLPAGGQHGWGGVPGETCEIAVFQVNSVPVPLERLVARRGWHAAPLAGRDGAWVRKAVPRLRTALSRRTAHDYLEFEHTRLVLTRMALRSVPASAFPRESLPPGDRVESAEAWFVEHMAEGPRLTDIARATHISVAHLRREFMRHRGISPRDAFDRLRRRRAEDLLGGTLFKHEAVSELCGFSSPANFSRAFRHWTGASPRAWQRGRAGSPARRRPAAGS